MIQQQQERKSHTGAGYVPLLRESEGAYIGRVQTAAI